MEYIPSVIIFASRASQNYALKKVRDIYCQKYGFDLKKEEKQLAKHFTLQRDKGGFFAEVHIRVCKIPDKHSATTHLITKCEVCK